MSEMLLDTVDNFENFLGSRKAELDKVAAQSVDVNRLVRTAILAAQKTPLLLKCSPKSIFLCLADVARLNLELGGSLAECHLVPFNTKYGMVAQLIIDYHGYITLMYRSGQYVSGGIYADVVRAGDEFEYELGVHRDIKKHVRKNYDFRPDGSNVTHAYCVAKFKDGGIAFHVMTKKEIDAVRNMAKAKDSLMWTERFERGAMKTCLKQMQHYLPKSVDQLELRTLDDIDGDTLDIVPTSVTVEAAPQLPTGTIEKLPEAVEKKETVSAPKTQKAKEMRQKAAKAAVVAETQKIVADTTLNVDTSTGEVLGEMGEGAVVLEGAPAPKEELAPPDDPKPTPQVKPVSDDDMELPIYLEGKLTNVIEMAAKGWWRITNVHQDQCYTSNMPFVQMAQQIMRNDKRARIKCVEQKDKANNLKLVVREIEPFMT